jgi:hypothetical protein
MLSTSSWLMSMARFELATPFCSAFRAADADEGCVSYERRLVAAGERVMPRRCWTKRTMPLAPCTPRRLLWPVSELEMLLARA